MLDEREFELINIIGGPVSPNQRDISRQMDLSLGMTNMLLRRLVTKGFLRIRQLDKRKVEYLLTRKGFSEKMQKSVNYTMKTIRSIAFVKTKLLVIVKRFYDAGIRKFFIVGGSDLASLIEMTMRENLPHDFEIIRLNDMPQGVTDGVVFVCCEESMTVQEGMQMVHVIEEMAKMTS